MNEQADADMLALENRIIANIARLDKTLATLRGQLAGVREMRRALAAAPAPAKVK